MTIKATNASTDKGEPTNSNRFYAAKHDLLFCTEVVKLAACATSMQRILSMIENAGKAYPAEMKKIHGLCDAPSDWRDMPHESIPWALNLAAQRMDDAADAMESAFMAAERAAEA